MTLQAKLTLGSVLLATLVVTLISAVDLGNLMQTHFTSTLDRAQTIRMVASDTVNEALNRPGVTDLKAALREPELTARLLKLLTGAKSILEIAVIAADTNEVLASTLGPPRVGSIAGNPPIPEFAPLVARGRWRDELLVLMRRDPVSYRLDEPLGAGGVTLFILRVVIDPTLIKSEMGPPLTQNAMISIASVSAAVLLTFAFSTVAFRTLGRIGRMLDQAAKGEYDAEALADGGKDELSIMASKVSLLGQRLRGAQFEVSDLRGNIDRLLEKLEDAVLVFNREKRLVFASGAVEQFLGHEGAPLPGQTLAEVLPQNTMLGLVVAQAEGRVRNRRVPMREAGASGPGPPVVLVSVDRIEHGGGMLVRLRDPEAQRKIGRELKTADRLSAISKVTSGVAHEVKNPLNAILLHVEVARAKLRLGETDVGPQLEIVAGEILRLDRVVRTFLDFTKPVELNLYTTGVGELVTEIAELARPQADSSGIRIVLKQQVAGVEVRVDRDLMKQAMLNLVMNSIEAMPGGGELVFDSRVERDAVEIRVADTGPGIPPELRDRIFRLYYTTKKDGSGIGLAMTFRIVQLHDGTIDFTSEPGKGTTFLIRLPIAV
jgi:signal transduction histidine kinase/HAMP domain-containing protein